MALIRTVIGLVIGLAVGLMITVVVIVAKVGFFVNTPRAAHPLILIAFFLIPAIVGAGLGFQSSRSSGQK